MIKLLGSLFDSNEKQLKKYRPLIGAINAYEEGMQKLDDEELREQTAKLRKRLDVNPENSRALRDPFLPQLTKEDIAKQRSEDVKKLENILPEAFASVREAAKRSVAHRAFDVQLLGAAFLSKGYVTELFTGEGKSLVAPFALYLYALMGKGAHLVTVNDYLARRDGEWAGHILNALGMSV